MAKPKTTATRLDLIEYQLGEVKGDTREIKDKLDNFTYVSQTDFDEFRKEVKETYQTKEELKPFKWVVTALGGAFLGALGAGLAAVIISRISNG